MRYVDNVTFKYCVEYSKNGKEMEDFFFTVRGIKSFLATEKPEKPEIFVWDTNDGSWQDFVIIKDFKPAKKKNKVKEDDSEINHIYNKQRAVKSDFDNFPQRMDNLFGI